MRHRVARSAAPGKRLTGKDRCTTCPTSGGTSRQAGATAGAALNRHHGHGVRCTARRSQGTTGSGKVSAHPLVPASKECGTSESFHVQHKHRARFRMPKKYRLQPDQHRRGDDQEQSDGLESGAEGTHHGLTCHRAAKQAGGHRSRRRRVQPSGREHTGGVRQSFADGGNTRGDVRPQYRGIGGSFAIDQCLHYGHPHQPAELAASVEQTDARREMSVGQLAECDQRDRQEQESETQSALALPDRPSIAVLPFHNLSGDPEQEYFADGVVEDIIAALSRMRWLFVIARNSSFAYKGRVADVKDVGRALGVRYVLEGSVRKTGTRVRITGQLIDTATGMHLWAERFEATLADIFALQDEMAESVVGAIAPQLERAEIERAKRKPTESLDAYDFYLRGVAKVHSGSHESIDAALPLFRQAIERDPDFASAYGMAAWCHFWRKVNGWTADRPREIAEGIRLARRAVEIGRDDAVALSRAGHALGHLAGDLDGGIALLDRAVLLNPNLASAWFLGGFLRAFHGEPDAAIEHLAQRSA